MSTDEEIKAAVQVKKGIMDGDHNELKSIYMAGEINMWLEMRDKLEWISVKDKLPDIGERVLCFTDMGRYIVAHPNMDYEFISSWDNKKIMGIYQKVTHWLTLPSPPTN